MNSGVDMDELVAWAKNDRNGITNIRVRITTKKCSCCGKLRKASSFTRDKQTADGLHCWCRDCRNEKKRSAYAADPTQRVKGRARHISRTYGLSVKQYEKMWAAQNGRCASCESVLIELMDRFTHVDHDHETGVVRGILCQKCNIALGAADSDSRRLRLLANYIDRHSYLCPTSGIIGHMKP